MPEFITGMHHVAIIASDKEKSLAFYKALGFNVDSSTVRPEKNDELLMLSGCGIVIELFIRTDAPPRFNSPETLGLRHLALKVQKGRLEEAVKYLRDAGYAPEQIRTFQNGSGDFTFVKDPDGLPIELHE